MKIISRMLLMLLFLPVSDSFAAMNGQFKGNIDGNDIDIPVSCQFGRGGFVSVLSDGINNTQKDSNNDGISMDLSFLASKQFVAYIAVKGKGYSFGGKHEVSGSKLSYKGSLKSKKRGDYEVDFTVTCKK